MDRPKREYDEVSSAEFRRTYSKLRQPTNVTALGRVIGQWIPANSATYVSAIVRNDEVEVFGLIPPEGAKTREPDPVNDPTFRFNTRPFTPVPKK